MSVSVAIALVLCGLWWWSYAGNMDVSVSVAIALVLCGLWW